MTPYDQGYHSMMQKLGFELKEAQPTPAEIAAMQKNVAAGKQQMQAGTMGRVQSALGATPAPSKNPLLAKKTPAGPSGAGAGMAAPRP